MCQLTKRSGITSDHGDVFICDQCNEDTIKFLETRDSPQASAEITDGEWGCRREAEPPPVLWRAWS
jgi:hypothetical protein